MGVAQIERWSVSLTLVATKRGRVWHNSQVELASDPVEHDLGALPAMAAGVISEACLCAARDGEDSEAWRWISECGEAFRTYAGLLRADPGYLSRLCVAHARVLAPSLRARSAGARARWERRIKTRGRLA